MKLAPTAAASVVLLAVSGAAFAETWRVPSPCATIQAGIDSATAGDVVIVAPGAYHEHDIVMKSGICLRSESGEPDGASIVGDRRHRILSCENIDNTASIVGFRFEYAVASESYEWLAGGAMLFVNSSPLVLKCNIFRNASRAGGGVACVQYSCPTLVNCLFFENSGGEGGDVLCRDHSSPVFTDCRFYFTGGTLGGSIFCSDFSAPVLTGCTFHRTDGIQGGVLYSKWHSSPVLRGCTIARSWGVQQGGAIFCDFNAAVTLDHSIIAFGLGDSPIYCSPGGVSLTCCDIYGNEGGDWVGETADQLGVAGNICADPLFCDACAADYTLDCSSPCANAPDCGLIGAHPVGCGASRVDGTTWSSLRALYRRDSR
jgi:hypothetical protein